MFYNNNNPSFTGYISLQSKLYCSLCNLLCVCVCMCVCLCVCACVCVLVCVHVLVCFCLSLCMSVCLSRNATKLISNISDGILICYFWINYIDKFHSQGCHITNCNIPQVYPSCGIFTITLFIVQKCFVT